jgi:hypothetical protein
MLEEFCDRFDDPPGTLWGKCLAQAQHAPGFNAAVLAAQRPGSSFLNPRQWKQLTAQLESQNLDPLEFMLWAYPEFWPRVAPGPRPL